MNLHSSVCLNSDQIKGLVSTAVVLVPAPGAARWIDVLWMSFIASPGSDYLADPLVFTAGLFAALIGTPAPVMGFFATGFPGLIQWHSTDGAGLNDPTVAWSRAPRPQPAATGTLAAAINLPITFACDFGSAITGNAAGNTLWQIDVEYIVHTIINPKSPTVFPQNQP